MTAAIPPLLLPPRVTRRAGRSSSCSRGSARSCLQKGPLWWAAHHRDHHRHSDTPQRSALAARDAASGGRTSAGSSRASTRQTAVDAIQRPRHATPSCAGSTATGTACPASRWPSAAVADRRLARRWCGASSSAPSLLYHGTFTINSLATCSARAATRRTTTAATTCAAGAASRWARAGTTTTTTTRAPPTRASSGGRWTRPTTCCRRWPGWGWCRGCGACRRRCCDRRRRCGRSTARFKRSRRATDNPLDVDSFQIAAALLTLAAIFSYLNHRWLKLPTTIGLMLIAMATSLALVALGEIFPVVEATVRTHLAGIDFNKTVMQGMLGFLLFAAALHVNLAELQEAAGDDRDPGDRGRAGVDLAGGRSRLRAAGRAGRRSAPGVLPAVRRADLADRPDRRAGHPQHAGAPSSSRSKIAGESLFNDGVGVVVFMGCWRSPRAPSRLRPAALALLFVREAVGGVVFGFVLGYGALPHAASGGQLPGGGPAVAGRCRRRLRAGRRRCTSPARSPWWWPGCSSATRRAPDAMSETTREHLDSSGSWSTRSSTPCCSC